MIATDRVSACLLSWKRPGNVEVIARRLAECDWIDEILVWNNNPDATLRIDSPKARVIASPSNYVCYGRFLCAAQARNEVIYTQDDDALVLNIEELRRTFLADPERIACALQGPLWGRRASYIHGDCHVAFLGWGAFLRRSWLSEFFRLPADVRNSDLFRREADKYFTVLLHRRHNVVHGDIKGMPGAADPDVALWLQPRHADYIALAVREALTLARKANRPWAPARWHVVIPCHHQGSLLEDSLRSVALNPADSLVTIVDNASTDASLAAARDLAGSYRDVDVLALPRKVTTGAALNRAIGARDSVFVLRLDPGQRVGPYYLRTADGVLSAGADVANPDAIIVGDPPRRWSVPQEVALEGLLAWNRVHSAAGFRRGHWAQVGGYDETMEALGDWDLWIRLARAGARIRRAPGNHFYVQRDGRSSGRPVDPTTLRNLGAKQPQFPPPPVPVAG